MISYFILNKSGNIIYQTVPTDKLESSEQNGIKYLPLLVIKDLIKNNLNTHIKHITTGDKVFAFWERHSLLYIACTKHERIPVSVLHKHLIVMDNFLRFNFGPQWQMRIEGNMYPRSRRHTLQPPLTIKKLTTCLEQLPYVTSYCSLRSPKCLCLIEQVDLQEDLSIRLIDTLQQCCNNVFIPSSSTITKPTIKISTLFSQPRKPTDKPIFYPHRHRNQHHNHNQQQAFIQKDIDRPFGVWEHAFLFAREKIVVHACNNKDQKLKQSSPENPIPTELLYFLKIMVADFIYEYCDTMEQDESSLIQHGASVPQAIESK
ncbi:hypothetical protein BJ944DRAFT_11738 [Cunninghamella echinulata]|nr:hypothetical protein BJ944DRAFT_11738 [Cunninghamella echinulata]